MSAAPVIEGWFTTGPQPALIGSRCTSCATLAFPPVTADGQADGQGVFCRNPACDGTAVEPAELSRRGSVWSYTDARYQPPAPYVPRGGEGSEHVPFALAAVALPEGLVVLGQVADGFGVEDLRVGSEVELVVEELTPDELTWRWKPVVELGEEAGR